MSDKAVALEWLYDHGLTCGLSESLAALLATVRAEEAMDLLHAEAAYEMHLEALQDRVGSTCACDYDAPGPCLWHQRMLTKARAEGAKARDFEWWEQTILVDNVEPTPEAGKAWAATMHQYAYDQGKAEGAREERGAVVDLLSNDSELDALSQSIERGDHVR
jgi:hypothetical protein